MNTNVTPIAAAIEPPPDQGRATLNQMSQKAYDLIRMIELESSGIRDGNGYWTGSDALDGTLAEIDRLYTQYRGPVELTPAELRGKVIEARESIGGNHSGSTLAQLVEQELFAAYKADDVVLLRAALKSFAEWKTLVQEAEIPF